VLMVPRVEGDVAAGKKVFKRRCASCHGRSGQGKAKRGWPRLVGQYPAYLLRQYDAFMRGARFHENEEAGQGVLTKISKEDFTNILAWLTDIQDQPPEEAGSGEDDTPR
jgi:cytochrome c553